MVMHRRLVGMVVREATVMAAAVAVALVEMVVLQLRVAVAAVATRVTAVRRLEGLSKQGAVAAVVNLVGEGIHPCIQLAAVLQAAAVVVSEVMVETQERVVAAAVAV